MRAPDHHAYRGSPKGSGRCLGRVRRPSGGMSLCSSVPLTKPCDVQECLGSTSVTSPHEWPLRGRTHDSRSRHPKNLTGEPGSVSSGVPALPPQPRPVDQLPPELRVVCPKDRPPDSPPRTRGYQLAPSVHLGAREDELTPSSHGVGPRLGRSSVGWLAGENQAAPLLPRSRFRRSHRRAARGGRANECGAITRTNPTPLGISFGFKVRVARLWLPVAFGAAREC
jgi:hypothetical protein